MHGPILQLFDREDPLRRDTTLLAAALLALGVPPAGRDLFHVIYEHQRGETVFQSTWTFAGLSQCKRFDAAAVRDQWHNPALITDPESPVATLRSELTYARAFSYTPRFTLDELRTIETPDTWLEAAIRNLIFILRQIPRSAPKGVIRLGPDNYSAFVPSVWSEEQKRQFLRYVERPDLRHQLSPV